MLRPSTNTMMNRAPPQASACMRGYGDPDMSNMVLVRLATGPPK